MDLFDLLLQSSVFTAALVVYFIVFKGRHGTNSGSMVSSWSYPLKLLCARFVVKRWKRRIRRKTEARDLSPRSDLLEGIDSLTFRCAAPNGTYVLLTIRKLCGRKPLSEITVHVQLPDGTTYHLPNQPDTIVGAWCSEENIWRAGGLKVEILEPWERLRVLYNGMLIRTDTKTVHHARLNLLWAKGSYITSHPEDWNNALAAEALAQEPWRDDNWAKSLDQWEYYSKEQWGSIQGWFQVQDEGHVSGDKTWLRARGVCSRGWTPHSYMGLRRSVSLMVTATNGTAFHLRAASHRDALKEVLWGTIMLANREREAIRSTDMCLEHFCETKDSIPKKYTMSISSDNRTIRVVLNIGEVGGRYFSGVPYQHEVLYRPVYAEIDGNFATGILELGYEPSVIREPTVHILPLPQLRWLPSEEVNDVGLCADFESPSASCPDLVGGKGASLALLASVQKNEGYKVPPGFCLTTKALETHLENNPNIKDAILGIEHAHYDYEENDFKEKCEKAVQLFNNSEITQELKVPILEHLESLRKKVIEEKIASEVRFAVRSSAIGEDSEALSAAGQNETVLGCRSDEDVLRAVLACWGSMFAFTSAHYRRQNGQTCMTGAGVVVQALVSPSAAGVLFTRHPQAGDPSRLLITANYGLGETVVSGTVEPDTYIISRSVDNELAIASVELGSKKQLIEADETGITSKEVSEKDRATACLTDSEALQLAKLAVVQEELWGAPRDIEWAINKDGIYLLQARPITSLEMWSEEELLHELDSAIMSEEDLVTAGNIGEVLSKPISPLGHSVLIKSLEYGVTTSINGAEQDEYEPVIYMSHYRALFALYPTLYGKVPEEIDIMMRMVEMAVHGHTVADNRIYEIAKFRHPPRRMNTVLSTIDMLKVMVYSGWAVNNNKKLVKNLKIDKSEQNDLLKVLKDIEDTYDVLKVISSNHCWTTYASSASQIIAIKILVEDSKELSNEHCQDLSVMLDCGGIVSAEVPAALSELARKLTQSGKFDDFKAQPIENGMNWLKDNLENVYKGVLAFLDKHGGRAIMEFDVKTVPWAIDSKGLIAVLQAMRVSNEKPKVKKSDKEIVASLITPTKPNTRKILPWILPLCRKMVARRETTKALYVEAIHKIRLAVRRLGELLVKKWFLPNMDLIFYLSLQELRKFIETRDPGILRKAHQRRQYFPKWDKLQFAEIQEGWPEPIKQDVPRLLSAGAKIVATPVCGGEVVARACVVPDLAEIDQLQHGDILITQCTDIGWSPYFPLISGIVTELGGLISHGAVIARECGLPCVVGANGAIAAFRTGDMIRLCGSTGVIEKVETEVTADTKV